MTRIVTFFFFPATAAFSGRFRVFLALCTLTPVFPLFPPQGLVRTGPRISRFYSQVPGLRSLGWLFFPFPPRFWFPRFDVQPPNPPDFFSWFFAASFRPSVSLYWTSLACPCGSSSFFFPLVSQHLPVFFSRYSSAF